MTTKTLYIFVSCCVEESRYIIMRQVIDSINDEQRKKDINIKNDLIVFDNGSTYAGTLELLMELNASKYCVADKNMGYWSALSWVFDNLETLTNKLYDYVYVIESDHFHFALEKIDECEEALIKHPELGSVRTQEYSVADKHLYNKLTPQHNSRRYAWFSHWNHVTNEQITMNQLNDVKGVYDTNFITCLHSLNRLQTIKDVFAELRAHKVFSEFDFQKCYHARYSRIGQHDGGVFHAKLGFTPENGGVLSGSWSEDTDGYIKTRCDTIRTYEKVEVS